MPTSIDWPSTLPVSFQQSSYSEAPISGVIRTEMDSGPPKVRRRFTAIYDTLTGNMVMTPDQLTTFKNFFRATINFGTLTFNFKNPVNLATSIEVRWVAGSQEPPYTIVPDGGSLDWQVSFKLETIP